MEGLFPLLVFAGLFLAITFILCVAFDLIFPQHAMCEAWHAAAGIRVDQLVQFRVGADRELRLVFRADPGAAVQLFSVRLWVHSRAVRQQTSSQVTGG
ncbi:MAG: hypothetical protein AB1513_07505 [Pseudomonadota bacterium]